MIGECVFMKMKTWTNLERTCLVSLVCSTAYPTTSISILLTGYDTSTKKENYRHPQHTRETEHSYSEQSNSKHLTSVRRLALRIHSIRSASRGTFFRARERAPTRSAVSVPALVRRWIFVCPGGRGFLFSLRFRG